MTDTEQPEVPGKKEAAVLTDESLSALATELGAGTLKLCMYLNVPTYTLVKMQLTAQDKGQLDADLGVAMLQYWKTMRATAKDKEKVQDLERGLRESGLVEMAETVADRHRDNMELTADCFPQ